MKDKNEYLSEFSPFIFWDVNINKLDVRKDKEFIIERILIYGRDNDIKLMFKLYKKYSIKKILKKADWLNPNTVAYFGLVLNIKQEHFKCYEKKQPHRI
jgi:hypothetical protein